MLHSLLTIFLLIGSYSNLNLEKMWGIHICLVQCNDSLLPNYLAFFDKNVNLLGNYACELSSDNNTYVLDKKLAVRKWRMLFFVFYEIIFRKKGIHHAHNAHVWLWNLGKNMDNYVYNILHILIWGSSCPIQIIFVMLIQLTQDSPPGPHLCLNLTLLHQLLPHDKDLLMQSMD